MNREAGMTLQGKTAVISGGSRGIGFACAQRLAQAGASLLLIGRSSSTLRTAAAKIGGAVRIAAADVTDREAICAIAADLGPIDFLINNAGTNIPKPILELQEPEIDRLIDLNLRSVITLCRAFGPGMIARGNGSVVNISSQMGHVGAVSRAIYCATKHAIEGLTKALALEWAAHGVRVNTVAPTFVETDMTRGFLADPTFQQSVLRNIPIGRMATAEEVAAAVFYLCVPLSASVTGTSLRVDGGWTAGRS